MRHRMFVVATIGLFLFSITFLGFTPVSAQSPEGLEIQPAVIEDRVDPGETYSFSLKVKNVAASQKTLYVMTQNITGLNERGLPIFAEDDDPTEYELSSWIVLPSESMTLAAGETRTVPFSIQVPANASPGAHFASVFFDARPERLRTTGAGIGVRVGSIINLRVEGEASEEARLREFSTEKLIYSAPPVTFLTKVESLGNVLLRPKGILEITDMFGKQVASVPVNDSGAPVFPGSEKDYSTVWEHEGFTFGKYDATVSLVYGDDIRKTITARTSFWILPAKPLLIVGGVILGFIVIMSLFTKLYIRNKLRELGVSRTGVNAQRQARKYQRSATRMMILVISIFLLISAFLVALFLMFA